MSQLYTILISRQEYKKFENYKLIMSLWMEIYDWISPMQYTVVQWFILTLQSRAENKYDKTGHLYIHVLNFFKA